MLGSNVLRNQSPASQSLLNVLIVSLSIESVWIVSLWMDHEELLFDDSMSDSLVLEPRMFGVDAFQPTPSPFF